MNNLDKQYQELLQDILTNGVEKTDRTGIGTYSVFGRTVRHNMSEGFPLLTTKKMYWKGIVTELLWFLRGDTNIKFLVDNDCNIWNGDAYKGYEKECAIYGVDPMSMEQFIQAIKNYSDDRDWDEKIKNPATHFIPDLTGYQLGDLGPVYGKQWRGWGRKNVTNYDLKDVKGSNQPKVLEAIKNGGDVTKYGVKIEYQNNSIDQIANLIKDLKTNPDSRRLMVNAWNVGELDQMVLPPCHYGFQVYTQPISLNERCQIWANLLKRNISYTQDMNHTELDKYGCPRYRISLAWNQRSADIFLGLPFNIASYGLLLHILAELVNMVPDQLIGNIGDAHIYLNHEDAVQEQLKREPYPLPELNINTEWWQTESGECGIGPFDTDSFLNGLQSEHFINCLLEEDIQLGRYQSHSSIKAQLNN